MDLIFPSHMVWWITVVDIPITTTLFFFFWREKKETNSRINHLNKLLDARHSQLRDLLFSYKLEVAKTYSTQSEMHVLENRIVSHLLRIEKKLDKSIERDIKGK